MLKTYKEELVLRTCDCDMCAAWRPGHMLVAMQEIAGMHSELLGVGRNALLNQGLAWVLTRMEAEVDRYPVIGERISVETFPMPVKRWLFPRYFVFRDHEDREIARAASLWVLFDLETRHMTKRDSVLALMPDNSDLPAPLGLPAPVTQVSGTLTEQDFMPRYTDMDCNHHVNNTRYMDWACDALGVPTLTDYEVARFTLNYDMEVKPGEMIHTELRRLDRDFSYSGFHEGERRFDVGGVLRARARR